MLRSLLTASSIVLVAFGSGCVANEDEDGKDDSFLGNGKADAFGVAEGSPDAIGVLALANSATLEQLNKEALISSNTAKAIIRHRQGADRMDGTADDDEIDTLTELDAIPYVGPMAFALLLDQARAGGFVPSGDPFDVNFCGKDYAMTPAMIRAGLQGADSALLPTSIAGIRVRTRTCVTPDNCPAWVNGTQPNMFELPNTGAAATPAPVMISPAGVNSQALMALSTDGRPVIYFESTVQVNEGATTRSAMFDMQAFPATALPDDTAVSFNSQMLMLDGKAMNIIGTDAGSTSLVGGHCVQLISRVTENQGATHREMVFFARY